MDSLTLHCFLAVKDTGSFTKAAEKICRTQSAVSQQIAKLESLLGVMLFQRGKQLTLTTEGEIFLGYAKQIVTLQQEALARFHEPELEGEVRFGLPEDFASTFLSTILQEFTALHPRILLNVECDLTVNLTARFKRGEFDMVLVKMLHSHDIPHGAEIWTETLEWMGGADYLTTLPEVIPLVLSPAPCVYRAHTLAALETAGFKWRIVFSSPSYASIAAAVKAGLGLTVLPRTMIPHGVHSLTSTCLPALKETHICLLTHPNKNHVTRSLEQFVTKKLV
jgi:DNA-binding transcriptional LysR family regulator